MSDHLPSLSSIASSISGGKKSYSSAFDRSFLQLLTSSSSSYDQPSPQPCLQQDVESYQTQTNRFGHAMQSTVTQHALDPTDDEEHDTTDLVRKGSL